MEMMRCTHIIMSKDGQTKRCGQEGGEKKMFVDRNVLKAGVDPAEICRCRLHTGDLAHIVSLEHARNVVVALNAAVAAAEDARRERERAQELKRQGNLTVAEVFNELKNAIKDNRDSGLVFFCGHAACACTEHPQPLVAGDTFVYTDHKLAEDNTLLKRCASFSCWTHRDRRGSSLTFYDRAVGAATIKRLAEAECVRKETKRALKAERKSNERAQKQQRATVPFDAWKRLQLVAAGG